MLRVVLAVLAVDLCLARIRIIQWVVLLDRRLLHWRLCVMLRIILIMLLIGVLRLGSKGRLRRRDVARMIRILPLLSLSLSLSRSW